MPNNPLQIIISRLTAPVKGAALSGINAGDQFRPTEDGDQATARNINAAFLIALSGPGHAFYEAARRYLGRLARDPAWGGLAQFHLEGIDRVIQEVHEADRSDKAFSQALTAAADWCNRHQTLSQEGIAHLWQVFFPEGVQCLGDSEAVIQALRGQRRVHIHRPNPDPIHAPAREVLFMSNLLITLPSDPGEIQSFPYSESTRKQLDQAAQEDQLYWYDHPIRIGVNPENNEAVYGLRGLNEAMQAEKARGTAQPDDRLTCLLSVSVTHKGLHQVVKPYLKEVYAGVESFPHLRVLVFSEPDARRIIDEILVPGVERYLRISAADLFALIFGVDGEYGRHYSFLKALSAFWKVLIDPGVKASFKIDMDQVFDQEALIRETGMSALEHFLTPLWGAEGVDARGRTVHLGMMAGALVNQKDIQKGLFTPDVTLPQETPHGESLIFYSRLPQAISTQAEMMTRYSGFPLDGVSGCIQRIHVTGGTCGALIRSLRKYRPFTPSFMGRAEDQAFLLGSLFSHGDPNLRYLHKPGLIMRHDKESFAAQAVKEAKAGKYVGDLVRILRFTGYCRTLPWPVKETKREIDPFTGCFVSAIPQGEAYLRLTLHLAQKWQSGTGTRESQEAVQVQRLAAGRLEPILKEWNRTPHLLAERVRREKQAWDLFYDLMDRLETEIANGDAFAMGLRKKAAAVMKDCFVEVGR